MADWDMRGTVTQFDREFAELCERHGKHFTAYIELRFVEAEKQGANRSVRFFTGGNASACGILDKIITAGAHAVAAKH